MATEMIAVGDIHQSDIAAGEDLFAPEPDLAPPLPTAAPSPGLKAFPRYPAPPKPEGVWEDQGLVSP